VKIIKPKCVKKSKIAQSFFTLASCLLPLASCLPKTTIFNANLLSLIAGMSMLFFTGFTNICLGYWLLTKSTNNTTKNIG
jgi:hypothetical protein